MHILCRFVLLVTGSTTAMSPMHFQCTAVSRDWASLTGRRNSKTIFVQCSRYIILWSIVFSFRCTFIFDTTCYFNNLLLYFSAVNSLVPRPSPPPVFDRLHYCKNVRWAIKNWKGGRPGNEANSYYFRSFYLTAISFWCLLTTWHAMQETQDQV